MQTLFVQRERDRRGDWIVFMFSGTCPKKRSSEIEQIDGAKMVANLKL